MKEHDELKKVAEEPRRPEDGSGLLGELAARNQEEREITVLVLRRPSRRFEQMLARELARESRRCGIHCWKGLCESLPTDFKLEKKQVTR